MISKNYFIILQIIETLNAMKNAHNFMSTSLNMPLTQQFVKSMLEGSRKYVLTPHYYIYA